jgi:DNA polymerase III gamma/tau subunit
MHITGKNGNTSVFSGTDILSESGVTSGFQEYAGGFDFSGKITTLIIEIGGRDINLAIGPLFDDVTVNVLYNVVNTIVTQSITSVEMWIAYGGSTETDILDIVDNIVDHNDFIEQPSGEIEIQPIEEPDMEVSYEIVEMEMEMPVMEIEMPEMEVEMPEIEVASVETEIEMEMEMEMEVEVEPTTEPEPEMEEPVNEPETKPETEAEPEPVEEPTEESTEENSEDMADEPEEKESVSEAEGDEKQSEDMEEPEDKGETEEKPVKKPESKKEKAAKKIVKKMGDKGRYDSQNQLKTLIVMQVLGNTKTFFDSQKQLNDRAGFFTDDFLPDAVISDNNIASYFLFAGSDGLMNEMVMQQWQK